MAKTRKILLIVLSVILGLVIVVGVFGAFIGFNFKDIGGGETQNVTTSIIGDYTTIDVTETAGSVNIVYLKSGESRVATYKKGNLYVETIGDSEKKTLYIKVVDNRVWYEKIFSSSVGLETTVYLPLKEYDAFKIKTESGSISVNGDFNVGIIKLSSKSGTVKCHTTANDSLLVSTLSGSVSLKSVGGNSVSVKSTSGAIMLDDIKSKTLNAESVSGRVEIIKSIVENKLVAKTTSGNIIFDYADAKEMYFYAVSGSVSGKVVKSKKITATTTSGRVTISDECKHDGGELLTITTTSGKINVDMYGELA